MARLAPNAGPFWGKPDLYHALQACLVPPVPPTGSIAAGLLRNGISPISLE